MEAAPDLREVDEMIASMDTAPALTLDSLKTVPPRQPLSPLVADPHATVARTTAEETDRKKPTPTSTPQLTPQQSEQSGSSTNSASLGALPLLVAATSEASPGSSTPLVTATLTATATTAPSSPRGSAVVAHAEPPLPITSEPPCDLDALTEFLRSESQPVATHHERHESLGHRASPSESTSDRASSVLPPILGASPKALSFTPHAPAHSAGPVRTTMFQKQASLSLLGQSTRTTDSGELSTHQLLSPRSSSLLNKQTSSPSRRRLTIGTHEISPHALERLGVNTDMLKKEKGMKKLGISDVDIERFEEIRRYSGVPHSQQPVTKVEFMFGFTKEQLLRVKAINRLGTSEEEVQDEYSRRISRLGVHDVPIAQN